MSLNGAGPPCVVASGITRTAPRTLILLRVLGGCTFSSFSESRRMQQQLKENAQSHYMYLLLRGWLHQAARAKMPSSSAHRRRVAPGHLQRVGAQDGVSLLENERTQHLNDLDQGSEHANTVSMLGINAAQPFQRWRRKALTWRQPPPPPPKQRPPPPQSPQPPPQQQPSHERGEQRRREPPRHQLPRPPHAEPHIARGPPSARCAQHWLPVAWRETPARPDAWVRPDAAAVSSPSPYYQPTSPGSAHCTGVQHRASPTLFSSARAVPPSVAAERVAAGAADAAGSRPTLGREARHGHGHGSDREGEATRRSGHRYASVAEVESSAPSCRLLLPPTHL